MRAPVPQPTSSTPPLGRQAVRDQELKFDPSQRLEFLQGIGADDSPVALIELGLSVGGPIVEVAAQEAVAKRRPIYSRTVENNVRLIRLPSPSRQPAIPTQSVSANWGFVLCPLSLFLRYVRASDRLSSGRSRTNSWIWRTID